MKLNCENNKKQWGGASGRVDRNDKLHLATHNDHKSYENIRK